MNSRIAPKRTPARSEQGQMIVLMALLLIGLLGAAALVVDGGRVYAERRSVQNAADNAALAAARAMCQTPAPSSSAIVTTARNSAAQNGFNHGVSNANVAVMRPPASGPNSGNNEYVEVVVTKQWQPGFLRAVSGSSGPITSSGRAVARCIPGSPGTPGSGPVAGGNGIVALNPSNDKVIEMAPSGCIKVNGGGVFVNSTNSSSVFIHGYSPPWCAEPRLGGQWLQFRGGYNIPSWMSASTVMGSWPPVSGQPAMSDPLAALAVPSQPAIAAAPSLPGCDAGFISGVYNNGNLNLGNHWCTGSQPVTLRPGRYTRFCISSDARAVMNPGLYYITGSVSCGSGGSFAVDGAATLTGNGVMIYVASGMINIGASGNVTLSAQTSGTYAGMAIFMARNNSSELRVSGAGVTTVTGTIYASNSRMVMTGSGTNKTMNAQVIARSYYVDGSGTITVNYNPSVVYGGGGTSGTPPTPARVELAE